VTLESALYDARVQKRFDVTTQIFAEEGVPVHRLQVEGDDLLSQLLQGTAWGDYVSVYLALLNGVDPSPVPQIVRLKAALDDQKD
jgi:glucose/mannose-6-phosphate isomerase